MMRCGARWRARASPSPGANSPSRRTSPASRGCWPSSTSPPWTASARCWRLTWPRGAEPALGTPIALRHKDQAISQDLAQSLLEYSRIKELTRQLRLPERPTYLELGAGYGRLAYVMLSARTCRYIIVDIPPTILVAKW